MRIEQHTIENALRHGFRVTVGGVSYYCGQMNYGEIFLEPGKRRGELYPFNKGTLWLDKKKDDKGVIYYEAD